LEIVAFYAWGHWGALLITQPTMSKHQRIKPENEPQNMNLNSVDKTMFIKSVRYALAVTQPTAQNY